MDGEEALCKLTTFMGGKVAREKKLGHRCNTNVKFWTESTNTISNSPSFLPSASHWIPAQMKPRSREEPPTNVSAASASLCVTKENVKIAFSWDLYARKNKSCCLANNRYHINGWARLKKSPWGTTVPGSQASEKVTHPSIPFHESIDSWAKRQCRDEVSEVFQ